METTNESRLMSVGELAATLQIHPKALYRMAKSGKFNDVRVQVAGCRMLRFDRLRVMKAIERGSIGGENKPDIENAPVSIDPEHFWSGPAV